MWDISERGCSQQNASQAWAAGRLLDSETGPPVSGFVFQSVRTFGFLRLALSSLPPPPSRHSTLPLSPAISLPLPFSLSNWALCLPPSPFKSRVICIAPRCPGQLPQLYSTELNEEHRPTLREANAKQRGGLFSWFLPNPEMRRAGQEGCSHPTELGGDADA